MNALSGVLDDVATFADSFKSHIERLGAALDALQFSRLKRQSTKCVFASHTLSYLGQQKAMRAIQDALMVAPILACDDDECKL